jgi:hypothetical protein
MKTCYEVAHFGLDGGAVPLIWSLPILSELIIIGLIGLAGCVVLRSFNLVYLCGVTGFMAVILLALGVARNYFFCGSSVPGYLLEIGHILPLLLLLGFGLFAVVTRSATARTAVVGIMLLGTIAQGLSAIAAV